MNGIMTNLELKIKVISHKFREIQEAPPHKLRETVTVLSHRLKPKNKKIN